MFSVVFWEGYVVVGVMFHSYLELFESTVNPIITRILERDSIILKNELVSQQDEAPAHYFAPVWRPLDQRFGKWNCVV